ncbi:ATP-dependent sacrificial sulfur transferase LarE [Acidicapsa dinghuensis]|uniref:ATP-dependent sacrificial sulfur transferase LarE n=1 Tax=Acidicapsa dinghuensis TaxID=2218256 RepID=A0ABW1EGE1_9BACT|nr:ATP-dependent sacrificial sulfur transferase LarE [Acidicapsa dinghuensis]
MPASECLSNELEAKRHALDLRLISAGRLMIAYSGGTDSAYLAHAAHRVLGSEMLAVLADSPSLSRSHLHDAVAFAEDCGIPLKVIDTHELQSDAYVRNDSNRCFYCKDELFNVMGRLGSTLGFSAIAYGMNVDDRGDFRPGQKAAAEHQVIAPLMEAGLTKQEIRTLAQIEGLRIWDKPASACLSSRIAYGLPVTEETLTRIEKAEASLSTLGLKQFRVRHHGDLARIEIAQSEMPQFLMFNIFSKISSDLKSLGYKYVTLDLEGYRSGSMNELLPISQIAGASARDSSNGVQ